MTIPSSLVLGPHLYKVDCSHDTALRLRADQRRGDSHADSLLIRLDPDCPHTIAAETLLHELLHMCWNQAAVNDIEGVEPHEEKIVAALSPLILELLRRNPDLADYLLKEEP
ncbi:MAG: hypothetical protein H0W42_11575 [Gemmatimonadaceae bacterium]|nr:hypothetical protein [Gemmatimonadaceae bacterium]